MNPLYILRPATTSESQALFAIHEAAIRQYVEETWGGWDDEMQRTFWVEHWPESRQALVA